MGFFDFFKDHRLEYYARKHEYTSKMYRSVATMYGGKIPSTAWVIDRSPTMHDANDRGEVLVFSTALCGSIVVTYDRVGGRPWHSLSNTNDNVTIP